MKKNRRNSSVKINVGKTKAIVTGNNTIKKQIQVKHIKIDTVPELTRLQAAMSEGLCCRYYSHDESRSTHTIVTQFVADLKKTYTDSVSSLTAIGT